MPAEGPCPAPRIVGPLVGRPPRPVAPRLAASEGQVTPSAGTRVREECPSESRLPVHLRSMEPQSGLASYYPHQNPHFKLKFYHWHPQAPPQTRPRSWKGWVGRTIVHRLAPIVGSENGPPDVCAYCQACIHIVLACC